MIEQWRPVTGYEGAYEVSDQGRVRSLGRIVKRGNGTYTVTGRILRPFKGDALNHQVVSFGKRDRHYVSAIVLEAFVKPRPAGYECCHNDGDPLNNRLSNLRWDSASGNQRDRLDHGTHHFARRTHCKQGHEYTAENTLWRVRTGPRYVQPSRARVCKSCVQDRSKTRAAA